MKFPSDIDRQSEQARPAGLSASLPVRNVRALLAGSLLLHALLLVGLYFVPENVVETTGEPATIAVDLVALANSAPQQSAPSVPVAPSTQKAANRPPPAAPTPPAKAPAAKAKSPVEPKPVKRTKTPAVQPTPVPDVVSNASSKTPEDQVNQSDTAQSSGAPPQEAVAQPDAAASQAGTSGSSTARGGPSGAVQRQMEVSYAQLLLTRLQRAIVYPRRAQRRALEGVVRVEVVLAPSGQLRRVALTASSGHDILDQAALDLVRRVAPFPPVPATLAAGAAGFAFIAPIQYQLN